MVSESESLMCQPCVPTEDDADVDLKSAMFNEPIVGEGPVLLDENGPEAVRPKPLANHR